MPPRARDALAHADVICAEDTRVTGGLLAALGIQGKRLERLDDNLVGKRAEQVVERVLAGEHIAYCSDAGMPGVSDPGQRLVQAARKAGAPVEVLPGPTAAVTAYVASGCNNNTFYFGGFFPRKDTARKQLLESLSSLDAALIFYESPNRILATLKAVADAFPTRTCTVCRELTKLHEEVVRGAVSEVRSVFANRDSVKGEIVIVIDPAAPNEGPDRTDEVKTRAAELLERGERPKTVSKQLVEEFGISRNAAYDLVIKMG